jgi:hypothetical protein
MTEADVVVVDDNEEEDNDDDDKNNKGLRLVPLVPIKVVKDDALVVAAQEGRNTNDDITEDGRQ